MASRTAHKSTSSKLKRFQITADALPGAYRRRICTADARPDPDGLRRDPVSGPSLTTTPNDRSIWAVPSASHRPTSASSATPATAAAPTRLHGAGLSL